METDIKAVDERLKELLGPLEEEEKTLLREKDELTARLTVVNGALQRVLRVKAVAFPQPRPVRKRGDSRSYVSAPRLEAITEFLMKQDEPISVPDTARTLRMSEPTVTKAFQILRDNEKIRISGKNDKNATTYIKMDAHGS